MTENQQTSRLTNWLASMPAPVFMSFAIVSSFSTYFCMYAFRKPFAAARYEGLQFLDTELNLKTVFLVSQLVGYALSKFIGIKVCSEVTRGQRMRMLVCMIVAAQLALFLFAVLPDNFKVVAIFLNGLPLGMVWGLVVWYLEGRRTSEMLLAGLSCSFIIASGVVKDIGRWLMSGHNVDQFWMPFVVGHIFLPPFLLSVWLLNQIPQPTDGDVQARVERRTMDRRQRWLFVRQCFPGLLMLLIVYFFLTAYRDFRDSFGVEILEQLGYGEDVPALFTRCELWVAFGVLGAMAMLNLIRNNRSGLIGAFVIMTLGTVMLGVGTRLHDAELIGGLTWMVLCGLGSYLTYVPFGTVLFDRLIASTRAVGTAVFAIYVADAVGYVGSISVMSFKDLIAGDVSRLEFFRVLTYGMALLGAVLLIASCCYFLLIHKPQSSSEGDAEPATSWPEQSTGEAE